MSKIHGVGLGLRWDFLEDFLEASDLNLPFVEISPENYMRRGGYIPAALAAVRERLPILSHGLTMSLGGTDRFDPAYFAELSDFLQSMNAPYHSDHLCWSGTSKVMLHDLLPLPHTAESVEHVVHRISEAQSQLPVPLVLENISWYAHLAEPEMSEAQFLSNILEQSNTKLLLDVNNVFVNAQNHGFDPIDFLEQIPLDRVVQLHVAGHYQRDDGLIIDTHGADVLHPVYDLMAWVVERIGPVPVLLERDQDIPPFEQLLLEVEQLQQRYTQALQSYQEKHHVASVA
jgi:uncharacterized protein